MGDQWRARHDGYTLISPHGSPVPTAMCSFPPNAKPLLSPCNLGWEIFWWDKRIPWTVHQPACTKPPSFLINLLEGVPQSETCAWIKLKAPQNDAVGLSVWSMNNSKKCLAPPRKISLSDPFELQNQNLYFAQLSNLLIHSIVSLSLFFSSSHYTKRESPLVHMNAISPFGLLICASYPWPVSLWRSQYILPYVFSMWRLLIR